ncbi:MAG: DUF2730 family protein [Rhodoblastus sp.]
MEFGNFAQIASAALGFIGFATAVWSSRTKRFDDKIAALATKGETADSALRADIARSFQRIDGTEQRLARVENELAHLPNKDMVHSLQLGMERLQGQMAALVERVTPLARSVDRVEQSLLERADR